MENKKNINKIVIAVVVIIIVVILAFLGYKQVKRIEEEKKIQAEQQAIQEQQKQEEEKRQEEERRKQEEVEQKEKQYADNSKYQCFKDDTFKIRFYYDNENLKYGSMIAQGGNKLALQEKNGDSMFAYSTNEMTGEYDKNQLVANFINAQVNSGFTIKENKDITISKIKPIEARYVECETGNVVIKNYLIYTDKGLVKFVTGGNIGTDSPVINEILDTIIQE